MDKISFLRYFYTRLYAFGMLCLLIYVMIQSSGPGLKDFQDHLYKKDFLIKMANLLRTKIGDRILPNTLIGKDGWVDYTGDGNIDDFQNLKPLRNERDLLKKLTNLNEYLKSQAIALYIVVAPNKATIYPDKLPEQIKSLPTESRLDQLIMYCNDHNLPIIVDLRPSLKAARENQDVYFKENNTHWNGYGAFVAYAAIINALRSSYPELKPYEIADMKLMPPDLSLSMPGPYYAPGYPFVQTLHLGVDNGRNQYHGTEYGFNQFSSIPDSKLPTLLMFHDSFGAFYLNDYLSMNFSKSYFIHISGQNGISPYYLSKESIQQFKPDIVIIEVVERDLDYLLDLLANFSSS